MAHSVIFGGVIGLTLILWTMLLSAVARGRRRRQVAAVVDRLPVLPDVPVLPASEPDCGGVDLGATNPASEVPALPYPYVM